MRVTNDVEDPGRSALGRPAFSPLTKRFEREWN
jgi:hypothetical protein